MTEPNYREHFGPTITAYANVADDPARLAELDAAFLGYLLVTAVRA